MRFTLRICILTLSVRAVECACVCVSCVRHIYISHCVLILQKSLLRCSQNGDFESWKTKAERFTAADKRDSSRTRIAQKVSAFYFIFLSLALFSTTNQVIKNCRSSFAYAFFFLNCIGLRVRVYVCMCVDAIHTNAPHSYTLI